MDWSGVDYCDVFIRLSFWRHPFTAEHPLLRHWCRDTWWRHKHIFSKSSFVNKLLLIWICKCEWTVESSRCVCEGTAGLLSVFPLSLTLTGLSDVICPAASEAEQIWCENNTHSFMSSGNCSSFNINQWLSAGFASGHWTFKWWPI